MVGINPEVAVSRALDGQGKRNNPGIAATIVDGPINDAGDMLWRLWCAAMIEQCGCWRRKEELEDAEEAAKGWA